LKTELSEIVCEKESDQVRAKTGLEGGADLPLDDLLALPYHRVPEGLAEFIRRAKENEFYKFDMKELERQRDDILLTLDVLARTIHTRPRGRAEAEALAEKETANMKKRTRGGEGE
jgi:hypothetical protein